MSKKTNVINRYKIKNPEVEVVEIVGEKENKTYKIKDNGKFAVGRPSITLEDLPKNWDKKMLKAFSQGWSKCEICAKILDIDYNTFEKLAEREEEFFEVCQKGMTLAQAFYEQVGRESLNKSTQKFNTLSYIFQMRNRFSRDWNIEGNQRNLNINTTSREVKPFELPTPENNKIEQRKTNLLEFYQKENDK